MQLDTSTYKIAEIIDRQQRLIPLRQKTKIYNHIDFITHATSMLNDNPLDIQEVEMLEIIKKYSNSDPYVKIPNTCLTEDELIVFSKEKLT